MSINLFAPLIKIIIESSWATDRPSDRETEKDSVREREMERAWTRKGERDRKWIFNSVIVNISVVIIDSIKIQKPHHNEYDANKRNKDAIGI